MEDDRGKYVVIAAGYSKEMEEFLQTNSGLRSRFSDTINFEDYNADEMREIFIGMCKKRKIEFAPGFDDALQRKLKEIYGGRGKDFANARTVRQLYDKTYENVSTRVMAMKSTGATDDERRLEMYIMRPEDIIDPNAEKVVTIDEALKDLNELVGLKAVKDSVAKIAKTLKAQKLTGEKEKLNKHFVFLGNPGTGKTTVARIMADVFQAVGMLPTNKLIETDRSKLVASYVGQTAKLVNSQCDSAMGGVLFIDEAYSLCKGQQDQFGQEAVDALLKRMEDDRGKYVVIAAGYSKEMEEFLQTNSGFKSRFSDYITFEDYNPDDMHEIFVRMCKKKKLEFAPGFDDALKKKLKEIFAGRGKDFANARTVRQLYDNTYANVSSRVLAMEDLGASEDDMKREIHIMHPEDIPGAVVEKEISMEDSLKELNELIGLKSVKDAVEKMAETLQAQKISGDVEKLDKHFVFMGNPGTGKTTVARIMANVFKALGVLPTNKLVEVERSKLVGQYSGHTAPLTNNVCDSAMGGVLFIDEAYALKQRHDDSFGQEAIDTLLQRIENDRGKFICIVAGYTKEMNTFLASNSGFKSRFSDTITFEDYNTAEMREIFISMCKKGKKEFADGFDEALQKRLEDLYAKRNAQFANARTVRQLYKKTYENVSSRVVKMQKAGAPEDEVKREINIMRPEDLDMTIS
jgi:SpoVK/Ycf46/Vps4 family AAA+-type ATPase